MQGLRWRGGVESMSRGAYLLPQARWGARMGDMQAIDYVLAVLQDPFAGFHIGITAENIAERYGITRKAQDELALLSQQRAARAIAEGPLTDQIVPIEVASRKGTVTFATDEHVRAEGQCRAIEQDETGLQKRRQRYRRQRLGTQ